MKALIICLCFSIALFAYVPARAQDKAPSKPLATQVRDGVEISILSIERMETWKNPLSMGDEYEAKQGYEWVVFGVQIKSAKSEVNFKQLEVLDNSDNKISSLTTELSSMSFGGKNIDQHFEVPFLVVKETRLRSLRIGDFLFELKNLQITAPKDVNEYALELAAMQRTPFKVNDAAIEKVNGADLFKEPRP